MIPPGQGPTPAPGVEAPPADSGAPPPPDPVASRRLMAAIEVVLCSGFPTQLLLAVVLGGLGLRALDDAGRLVLAYIVVLSLTDSALLLGLIFVFLWLRRESPREVFFGVRPAAMEVALGIVLTPVMVVAAVAGLGVIESFAPWLRNVPENPLEALLRSPANVLLFAFVAVVAGGLREELQRAFVLRRFEQHLGGGWVGLVVFSVAFGLGHQIQGWDAAIITATLGAIWGAMYLVRRSALAAMVSHAGFNLSEIVLAVFAGTATAG